MSSANFVRLLDPSAYRKAAANRAAPPTAAPASSSISTLPRHDDNDESHTMPPLLRKAAEAQRELRRLRSMMQGGPSSRRLGDSHPEVHPERLAVERDMLADLEDEGFTGAELIKQAAAARKEYELELQDLLAEAEEQVESLRDEIQEGRDGTVVTAQPAMPMPHAASSTTPATAIQSPMPMPPPLQPSPGSSVDDLLGLSLAPPPVFGHARLDTSSADVRHPLSAPARL